MVTYAVVGNLSQGLIIDREKFFYGIELEFADFAKRLNDNDNNFVGQNLRMNCKYKMDLICA